MIDKKIPGFYVDEDHKELEDHEIEIAERIVKGKPKKTKVAKSKPKIGKQYKSVLTKIDKEIKNVK